MNDVRRVFETRIRRGKYEPDAVTRLIDMYHINGKLSDDDHEQLQKMASENASTHTDDANVLDRLAAIEQRVKALEEREEGKRGENC